MNQLTTRTTAVFATAMIAMIILGFAAVMTVIGPDGAGPSHRPEWPPPSTTTR